MAKEKKGGGNMLWMLSTFLLVGILVGLGVSSLGGDAGQAEVTDVPEEIIESSAPSNYTVPDVDDDAFLGSEDAPLTMIEFSDFECPYCQRFEATVFPLIKTNFIDTGLVKFVYRDFPLSFHEKAFKAHEAAECAGDYDKYWEMHDAIVANYEDWTVSEDLVATFIGYAEALEVDADAFSLCLENDAYVEEVNADITAGRNGGISGTPSFYIGDEMVVGALPYEDWQDESGAWHEGFESILNRLLEEVQ